MLRHYQISSFFHYPLRSRHFMHVLWRWQVSHLVNEITDEKNETLNTLNNFILFEWSATSQKFLLMEMTKKIFHQYYFSHTSFGDISSLIYFMPFHYWLCVVDIKMRHFLFALWYFLCLFSRPFPLENKWCWMQCQREKEQENLFFYWIFTSHTTKIFFFKNEIYVFDSHADSHPPKCNVDIAYISSFLLRAHAHKIIHNTIWYLSPVCTNIIHHYGKLTSLKCLKVIQYTQQLLNVSEEIVALCYGEHFLL